MNLTANLKSIDLLQVLSAFPICEIKYILGRPPIVELSVKPSSSQSDTQVRSSAFKPPSLTIQFFTTGLFSCADTSTRRFNFRFAQSDASDQRNSNRPPWFVARVIESDRRGYRFLLLASQSEMGHTNSISPTPLSGISSLLMASRTFAKDT